MKTLETLVTADQMLGWIIIALMVGYFIYKEWPEFRRRISGRAVDDAREAEADRSAAVRMTAIETDIRQIKEKLDRDYGRLNSMERWRWSMQKMAADSLEEREILMQAMLGVLGGLQEIGANGPTKEAEKTIRSYINRKAHKQDERLGKEAMYES